MGNGHIVLREVFFEVFEAAEGSSAFLDLVYDDEGILRHDVHTGMSRKGADDTRDVVVWFEECMSYLPDGLRQEQVVCGLYVTSTQAVTCISLFSYNKNLDEYSVKINKNLDDNPW